MIDRLRCVGSAHHKLHPGDYGLAPPQNPRASKSPCDELRTLLLQEAIELFKRGIEHGMVSPFPENGVPKYVWSVDADGEVYEAKTRLEREIDFHGYRVGEDERAFRVYVLKEWRRRCP